MDDSIFRKLGEKIDLYSIGFNETKSGVEFEILRRLFTGEEALIFLNLERRLETADVIAHRAGLQIDKVTSTLESMTAKGLTFPRKKNGINYYSAAPFIHGIYENNALTAMDKDLAEVIDRYFDSGFAPKTFSMKTLPISLSIDTSGIILPYDDVKKIIESKEKIGLMNCACATKVRKSGRKCSNPLDVCIAFDYYAEYAIEFYRQGRWITQEEALNVLEKSEKEGLIHQVAGSLENIERICNCCPDCCTGIHIIKKLATPAKAAKSNYLPQKIDGRCFLCGDCIRRCPLDALSLHMAGGISVDSSRCIGCGLCVTACPAAAIELTRKPEEEITQLYPTENYQFMRSSLEYDRDIEN